MTGAVDIISSKFGIFHASVDSSMILSFTGRNFREYLGLKNCAAIMPLTDIFPELIGLEDEIKDVFHGRRGSLILNAINRTVINEIFFNIYVFPDSENPGKGFIILEDITQGSLSLRMVQQKKNEMILHNIELMRRGEFIANLINTIPDPVFYKDSFGRYIGCNREFENLTGLSSAELSGKTSDLILSADRENNYDRYDKSLLVSGGSISYEAEIIKHNGEKKYVIINKSVFHDEDYGGSVIVGVITDITSRRQMEEQLNNAMTMLEISRLELKDKVNIMEKNLFLAKKTVDAFLQKDFPILESFEIECRYFPLEQIGGDFYSVIPFENGINIFICDISGHGVSSALFLSLIKYFSESILHEYGNNPARYMNELNSIYLKKNISSNFFTAIFGILSINKRIRFSFANGGHPYPVLMKKDGRAMFLGSNDTVVGVFENQNFREYNAEIETGDMLFFYTDGIPETHDSTGKIIGYRETLLNLFMESRDEKLNNTMDNIIKKIINFRGDIKQEDDILLLGFHALNGNGVKE
jgi:PAS domain S-box-containing protein